jgi:hypothetical protein
VTARQRILLTGVTLAGAWLGLVATLAARLADELTRAVGPCPWPEDDGDEAGQWVPVRTWRGDTEGWRDQ